MRLAQGFARSRQSLRQVALDCFCLLDRKSVSADRRVRKKHFDVDAFEAIDLDVRTGGPREDEVEHHAICTVAGRLGKLENQSAALDLQVTALEQGLATAEVVFTARCSGGRGEFRSWPAATRGGGAHNRSRASDEPT